MSDRELLNSAEENSNYVRSGNIKIAARLACCQYRLHGPLPISMRKHFVVVSATVPA